MNGITIAIAEDNTRAAELIRRKLATCKDFSIVICEPNGRELMHALARLETLPDIVLMDIQMPVLDGIAATLELKGLYPSLRVLALTTFDDDENLFQMIQAGASGYLLKDISAEDLVRSIRELLEGGAPLSPSVALKILHHVKAAGKLPSGSGPVTLLSAREREVLELVRDGLQNKEIADRLFISPQTVRKHIEHIYRKLQVSNRVEAIRATE